MKLFYRTPAVLFVDAQSLPQLGEKICDIPTHAIAISLRHSVVNSSVKNVSINLEGLIDMGHYSCRLTNSEEATANHLIFRHPVPLFPASPFVHEESNDREPSEKRRSGDIVRRCENDKRRRTAREDLRTIFLGIATEDPLPHKGD
jgi:hypothetical protein